LIAILKKNHKKFEALIAYTRNFEQITVTTQKDLSVKKDFQAQRLEG